MTVDWTTPRVTAAVRGVAFAGDRGISKVEVTVDGGRTWSEARITYGRSKLAWVLWEAGWTPNGTVGSTITFAPASQARRAASAAI